MERTNFDYSLKTIPICNPKEYLRLIVAKTDKFLRNSRWKVWHFKNAKDTDSKQVKVKQTYGFRTVATPPIDMELYAFEQDMLRMIKNIKFRSYTDNFQKKVNEDM